MQALTAFSFQKCANCSAVKIVEICYRASNFLSYVSNYF